MKGPSNGTECTKRRHTTMAAQWHCELTLISNNNWLDFDLRWENFEQNQNQEESVEMPPTRMQFEYI